MNQVVDLGGHFFVGPRPSSYVAARTRVRI